MIDVQAIVKDAMLGVQTDTISKSELTDILVNVLDAYNRQLERKLSPEAITKKVNEQLNRDLRGRGISF